MHAAFDSDCLLAYLNQTRSKIGVFSSSSPIRQLLIRLVKETAHQVISMNSGPKFLIRSIRSYKFCRPYSVSRHSAQRKWPHLCSSRRKVFEAPVRSALSLGLLQLFRDLHGGLRLFYVVCTFRSRFRMDRIVQLFFLFPQIAARILSGL